ncbi:MAG: response regulator, partial [Burkholderiales bacterium]|nr:response regulator [Burkholderiales bacterium]
SSALLADAVMTVHGQASGTAVLAQVYAALRDKAWVCPPALWADALLVALAALPALWTVWRGRVAPSRDAALAGLALLIAAALAGGWLIQLRLPTLWAAPLASAATGLALSLALHYRRQAQAQQRLAHELAVAAEAARIKSEFLANVSHEIRTPLNALLGVAELLGESALTPTQQRQVRLFQEAGHTLHELINDLLDLSKIEAGRLELEREAFSLHRVLEGVVELLRPHAERKGLVLAIELAPDLPDGVQGDRRRLERAVTNLVGNAVKFTARGEVRLRAEPDATLADGVSIAVSDSGIGIAPSKLETIFEPFSQADGSVTRMYGGTGLGLAITRSVAELMGGAVAVRSTPGLGSVFTLRLPLPRAAVAPARPRPGAAAVGPTSSGAQLRVLLAEDNEVNAYIFRAMLEGQPLTIDGAPNGPTALDLLTRRRYDIAFIDVQMPGMDGLSVTRELRQLEARSGRPRTPVVALTAGAFAADIQASAAAGCDRHLTKPVTKAQLLDTLRQLATGQSDGAAPPAARDPWLASTLPMPFDPLTAVERLGGDDGLYQRVLDHSRVFLEAWSQNFDRARSDGQVDQARRLAHDLKAIAGALCADELYASAAALEQAIGGAGPAEPPVEPLVERLRAALQPVIVALSRSRPGP